MGKKYNLEGQRFGMLTVLERTEETQDRYVLWRCRCDCGEETFVNTRRLLRGTITDCGCIPKKNARNGPRAENLTGRKFGELTALRRTESWNGRTRWVCMCSCGTLHTVYAHDLKKGSIKSCGCKRYENDWSMVNISGQRFGRLVAVCATDKRDKKGSVYWHCRCDCGNELDVTENCLMHGNCKSCGCLRKEAWKKIPNQLHWVDGTCVEMLEKRKSRCDNTSGFRGVHLLPNGRYRVSIGFKGKRFYIGTYIDYGEAVRHRLEIENLIHDGFVKAYYGWMEKAETDSEWADENPLIFEVQKNNGEFQIITNEQIEY